MNPVTLPAAWAPQQQPAPWVEARHADLPGPTGDRTRAQWTLQRRCALSPAQFGACFLALAGVSALVAGFFWAMGARFVTLFAGIEVLAVAAAFVWHAWHAADGERLHLSDGYLLLECRDGARVHRERIDLQGLRVGSAADGSIELNLRGRRWKLGRHADEAHRRHVLAGLRQAVPKITG